MSLYSAGVEYGIHCLLFLVDERGDSRESSVRDLAELQGVPQEYLAKVFTKLARAGLVAATEGVRGGFRLARPSDEITVLDIVTAIDGPKKLASSFIRWWGLSPVATTKRPTGNKHHAHAG